MAIVYACIAPHPPVMVPAVGRGREQVMPAVLNAMSDLCGALQQARPESAVIITSHGPARWEAIGVLTAPTAAGTLAEFGAPQVQFQFDNDVELAQRFRDEAKAAEQGSVTGIENWGRGLDWGCLVPLYFLHEAMVGVKLMPVVISAGSAERHFEVGHALARAVEGSGRRTAVICSADLSHALSPDAPARFDPAGALFDAQFRQAVERWDVRWVLHSDESFRRRAAEDAVRQTALLMGSLSGYQIRPRVLAYDAPFGVGYLVASIDVLGPRRKQPTANDAASRPR